MGPEEATESGRIRSFVPVCPERSAGWGTRVSDIPVWQEWEQSKKPLA